METKYYWLVSVIILTMIMKMIHDVLLYFTEKEKNRLFAAENYAQPVSKDYVKGLRKAIGNYIKLRHLFGVLMITVPTLVAPLVFLMPWGQYLLGTLAAALIYLGFFNNIYNRGIGKNPAYLGQTDVVDQFLRWVFKIDKDPDNPAKNKFLVLWIRAGLGMFGIAIILSIMSF